MAKTLARNSIPAASHVFMRRYKAYQVFIQSLPFGGTLLALSDTQCKTSGGSEHRGKHPPVRAHGDIAAICGIQVHDLESRDLEQNDTEHHDG